MSLTMIQYLTALSHKNNFNFLTIAMLYKVQKTKNIFAFLTFLKTEMAQEAQILPCGSTAASKSEAMLEN